MFTKKLDIDNELCLLDILDTCGTDKFSQIKQQHISYAQGFVLVFAVDNKRTFEDIEIIRMQVRQETDRGRVPGWKLFGGREWCMVRIETLRRQVHQMYRMFDKFFKATNKLVIKSVTDSKYLLVVALLIRQIC